MLFVKSAKRAIRRLVSCLTDFVNETPAAEQAPTPPVAVSTVKNRQNNKKAAPEKQEPAAKPQTIEAAPVRPKHIDQYVHLLPEKTQVRAGKVKQLLDALDFEREQARLLLETGDAAARAQHMTAATKIDNQLRSIYKELNSEWEKLVKSGKVVVDDLGNARVVDVKSDDEVTEPVAPEKPSLSTEQREHVRALRHFLKDTRRGNGRTRAEHIKKWKSSYAEMVAIAGPDSVTDKVREAAKHYGIEINQ